MSHKGRNKRYSDSGRRSQAVSVTRRQREIIQKMAGDGYTNETAGLGEASPLMTSGTFVRSNLTSNITLLTTLYRESWLAKRIIDMPSEDMTRSWIRIVSAVDEEDMQTINKVIRENNIRKELTDAVRWGRLYGGAVAVIVIKGEEEKLELPLMVDDVMPESFAGLLVLDKSCGVMPSLEKVTDLDDPDYGMPEYYVVDDAGDGRSIKVHHSRVLRFIGRELPRIETEFENFWGASELEHIWEELQKRSSISANIAQLVFRANITTLKMGDFGEILALGTDSQKAKILNALEIENKLRTSFGLQLLSSEDAYENHPYAFGGLGEIYELFMMDMAGAAEIPATRLFGRSPQGMNATGESDIKNYYEHINSLQESVLRPVLDKLLPIIFTSVLGYVPDDLDYVFEPLATQDPQERAAVLSSIATSLIGLYNSGIITRKQAIEELSNMGNTLGMFSGLDKTLELNTPGAEWNKLSRSAEEYPEGREAEIYSRILSDINRLKKEG